MATPTRRTGPSLEEQLRKQTYEFDFHQAIRLLEKLRPGSHPLGEGPNPLKEAVAIESRVTQSPSGADLQSLELSSPETRPVLTVNFLGIGGIQGPLPTPYTELLVERLRHKDTGFKDFLDIFNHRLASFWHRMRKKVVLGIAQVRPETTPAGKSFLDLVGIDSPYLQNRLAIPDQALLAHTAVFWKRPRSLIGLQRLLRSTFGLPITVSQFQGAWLVAEVRDWTKIGSPSLYPPGLYEKINLPPTAPEGGEGDREDNPVQIPLQISIGKTREHRGQHQVLGKSAVLGRRSWCQVAGIAVHIPPLTYQRYVGFQKGSKEFKALRDLTYFYIGEGQQVHITFSIQRHQILPTRLNGKFGLGRTTWMTRGEGKGFADDPKIKMTVAKV